MPKIEAWFRHIRRTPEKPCPKTETTFSYIADIGHTCDTFFSGYSDQFTGLVTSLFLFCGTFAALPVTIMIGKLSANGNFVEDGSCKNPAIIYTKLALTVGAGSTIGMLMLAQMPGQHVRGDKIVVQITTVTLSGH